MTDDPLVKSRREAAIREALRLHPEINPTLAGWVFDYVKASGRKKCCTALKRAGTTKKKCQCKNKQ